MDASTLENLMTVLTQFGAAGLIGLLWIVERRASLVRDRQLQEAHERLMSQQLELKALLRVVKDNTVAVKTLELAQRRLIEHLNRQRPTGKASAA